MFLSDYDMLLTDRLVQGADVWLKLRAGLGRLVAQVG